MRLSKNFKLEEFLVSKTYPELIVAIHIPPQYKWNLFKLAKIHLQNIRDFIKLPMHITSGFRTRALNKQINGASASQHLFGEAADFVVLNKQGEVDTTAMEEALGFIKSHLWPAVGECIQYRDAASRLRFIHLSLPDPRYCGVFRTIRSK